MAQHLNIVVCLRPPEDGVAAPGIGPRDLAALEYAVRLARPEKGAVTVLATGGPECFSVLREGVARGATTSVHVRAESQTTDPLETARRLHTAVRDLNPPLVLCGSRSSFGMHGAVPRELANLLGMAFVGSVVELEVAFDRGSARAVQALEHGDRWAWGAPLPLVCGVEKELCRPRYLAIRRAQRADSHQPESTAAGVGDTDDPSSVPPEPGRGVLVVRGRTAPRVRPKKSMVATSSMSATDRMAMLRAGGKGPAPGIAAGEDDSPKRVSGDPVAAAAEIIALLEKRGVLDS